MVFHPVLFRMTDELAYSFEHAFRIDLLDHVETPLALSKLVEHCPQ